MSETAPACCYRMATNYRNIGWGCTAFFLLIGSSSTYAAAFNIDGSFSMPTAAAWIFGLFWGAWTLGGIWLILEYHTYSFKVTEDQIIESRILGQTSISIADVTESEWKQTPRGGSVTVHSNRRRIKIAFGSFSREDRHQLIPMLQIRLPEASQHGWETFSAPWWQSM
jgi:hypothetical protein